MCSNMLCMALEYILVCIFLFVCFVFCLFFGTVKHVVVWKEVRQDSFSVCPPQKTLF